MAREPERQALATAQLAVLLSHYLATDSAAGSSADLIEQAVLQGRLIAAASAEDPSLAEPVLQRWSLRLTSLLQSSRGASARALGLKLCATSVRQSETFLLRQGKTLLTSCMSALTARDTAPQVLSGALQLSHLLFEASRHLQEFSREVTNAPAVRKLAESAIKLSSSTDAHPSVRIEAAETVANLLSRHAAALRPLANDIQQTAIHLICSSDESLSPAGSLLLAKLYLTASASGASNAWRKTVEGLVACIEALLPGIVTTLNDYSVYYAIQPLAMPLVEPDAAIASSAFALPEAGLLRLERLILALRTIFRQPTLLAVAVPVEPLVNLVYRLLSYNLQTRVKPNSDPGLHAFELGLLPRLHRSACALLAQLSLGLSSHLCRHSGRLLTTLSQVASTYAIAAPGRSMLYRTADLLLSSCPVDPDECARSGSHLLRLALQDIAAMRSPPEAETKPEVKVNGHSNSRQAKRARLFETDQTFSTKPKNMLENVASAEAALQACNGILTSVALLLEPKVLHTTLRLLISLVLPPSFLAITPVPSPDVQSAYDWALAHSTGLRPLILQCLVTLLPLVTRDLSGYIDHLTKVLRACANANDLELRQIALSGLTRLELIVQPRLPPRPTNEASELMRADRWGGELSQVDDDLVVEKEAAPMQPNRPAYVDSTSAAEPAAPVNQFQKQEATPFVLSAAVTSTALPRTLYGRSLESTTQQLDQDEPAKAVELAEQEPGDATLLAPTEPASAASSVALGKRRDRSPVAAPAALDEDSDGPIPEIFMSDEDMSEAGSP
ncbi:uncharacterized protein L969DRAFT_91447 [Mixia osmundae IAM 14324]|uniref:Pre-rRNA-processing protein RIX1 n=1 Tax=Mixia osmundae (strain CBS 9802 / IAM 14324 / JCM 22182 / KY 12970) TaxID=764103 RepID=G7E3X5_MIXOS|nr:uncharacterized protein L969DRAFT_91447 [Mixia osmundae IAM 14324]KEI41980.1 hypothetical protein L969DRAFT_91447 [Mixia osmundae IAM 14324]GAA97535.1 hypothetical protein E5Q_04213 [Mixia osmundae IAM 14324]